MEKSAVASKFLENNITKTQAQRRLRVLRDFENWRLFEAGAKSADKELIDQFTTSQLIGQDKRFGEVDGQFLMSLGAEFLNWFDARNLTKELTDLEASIGKAKQITIYIAIELPSIELEKVGLWFKKNVGPECLIDIQYRGTLIGGAAISYKGVIKDYSIQSRIESQKREILKTLLDFRK